MNFAAYIFEQRLKNGSPHSGHLATRTNLYEFLLSYMDENQIIPKSKGPKNEVALPVRAKKPKNSFCFFSGVS